MSRNWFRALFGRPAARPTRRSSPRARLGLEAFEDRTVPAVSGSLPNQLVWLKAEGTAADAMGTSNGALVNGATFATGVSGQGFSLDGMNDYVRVPFPSPMPYGAGFSADAWIKPTAFPVQFVKTGGFEIFNQTTEITEAGNRDIFLTRLMYDGSVLAAIHTNQTGNNGGFWVVRSPAHSVPLNTFSHVAVTLDQATKEFDVYVNGAKTSQTVTGSLIPTVVEDFKVGADLYNNTFFKGVIDEPALYNRPLTQGEVNTIVAIHGPTKAVVNTPPAVAADSADVGADEGGTVTNTGTFSDAQGNGTVSLSATVGGVPVGTVTKNDATGTWGWSLGTDDGPAGPTTVTITATDNQGAVTTTSFTYSVANVDLTADLQTTGATYGDVVAATLANPSDPSGADAAAGFHYAFSLDTNTTGSATYASAGTSTAADFGVLNAGTYTVFARVIDKDGGSTPYSITLTVAKAATMTVTVGAGPFTYDTTTHGGGSGTVTGAGGLSTAATSVTYTGDRVKAGTYYVTAHYAGDANHEASDGQPVAVVIKPKVLDATASSPGTVNIGSNGTVMLHLSVAAGQLYGADTVASLFNGATFTIRIQKADGTATYGTLTSTAQADGSGHINVSMQMSEELRAALYQAYTHGGSVNFEVTATANGGNYALDEDTVSRLLNNGANAYTP